MSFCGTLTGIEIINSTDVAATFPANSATAMSHSPLRSTVDFLGLFVACRLLLF